MKNSNRGFWLRLDNLIIKLRDFLDYLIFIALILGGIILIVASSSPANGILLLIVSIAFFPGHRRTIWSEFVRLCVAAVFVALTLNKG
jgi:hypothetical protein